MSFTFRQFHIADDRCAMKVGTDGVLLGAWANIEAAQHLLDIGTGSGLIALMAAQRTASTCQVVGVDIDHESVEQAMENVRCSTFAHRIQIVESDIRQYHDTVPYDHILCNPPYHQESLLPPDSRRAAARHTQMLSLEELIAAASKLLTERAYLHLITPSHLQQTICGYALRNDLHLTRLTYVKTTEKKQPKRILTTFQKNKESSLGELDPLQTDTLTLLTETGQRTAAHQALTRAFYL